MVCGSAFLWLLAQDPFGLELKLLIYVHIHIYLRIVFFQTSELHSEEDLVEVSSVLPSQCLPGEPFSGQIPPRVVTARAVHLLRWEWNVAPAVRAAHSGS